MKIAVKSLSEDPINDQFVIWVTPDEYTLLLQPGVTQKYTLRSNSELIFKVLINREPSDLSIKADSLENKVKLYLSVDSAQTNPHESYTDFKSNEKGEILLTYEESIKDHCRYF